MILSVTSFLKGNYGPVQEEVTVDSLKVIGEIPKELDGLYVRNGPNPFIKPTGPYHWFEGDGMLHGVRLTNGKSQLSQPVHPDRRLRQRKESRQEALHRHARNA